PFQPKRLRSDLTLLSNCNGFLISPVPPLQCHSLLLLIEKRWI
ncbi:lipoprotein, partial [Neisseria shayeganii 871]